MTPEQQKLVQKLATLSDLTYIQKSVNSLVIAISEMDCSALELILEDEVSYHDTTKTIFLQKLEGLFEDFKKVDSKLIAHEGKCNSAECGNKNKRGFCFIGNNSGRYINFIVEENENGSIKDIYTCYAFCTNVKVMDRTKPVMNFFVYYDEKIDFKPSPTYTTFQNKSIAAMNELKQFDAIEISKEQIISWVDKYEDLHESLCGDELYKDIATFYECYSHIKNIYKFLYIEKLASIVLAAFKTININNEKQLLEWLVDCEDLHFSLLLLHPNIISEESLLTGKIILHKNATAYFDKNILKNCVNLAEILDTYYYKKVDEYNTLSKEEQDKMMPFDEDYKNASSLTYHLKKRGIFK